jgi:hypothetical protein
MTLRQIPRRAVLLVVLALAACGSRDDPPTAFAPVSYDYLTKLRLNVSSIDIDDSWSPRPDTREMGSLAPTTPVEALRQMAHDRLVANGAPGRAVFVIDDASIIARGDTYDGHMTVHLDVTSPDGTRSGYAEARVARTAPILKDTPNATRAALAALVDKMMDDMNVEFEYQVRRSLRSYLQTGPTTPVSRPIQSEELTAPVASPPGAALPSSSVPVAPPSSVPQLSPPPTNLMPPSLSPPPSTL